MIYVFSIVFIIMAYLDCKKGIIYDSLYIPLLFYINNYKLFIILLFFLFILYRYIENYIGGADLKITIIMLCVYTWDFVNVWLLISVSLSLCYCLITKKKEIRMFAFFAMSYVITSYVY